MELRGDAPYPAAAVKDIVRFMAGERLNSGLKDARRSVLNSLAQAYTAPLTRFFSRRVSAGVDVPDLVQDVFLRLSGMSDPGDIRSREGFVFVTAANVLKDRARKEKARSVGLHEPIDDHADDLESSEFAPDRVLESREAAALIRVVLAELPERTRHVFVLRLLEGWRMSDVAAALGVSTRAAEKHQARALAAVADRLRDWR